MGLRASPPTPQASAPRRQYLHLFVLHHPLLTGCTSPIPATHLLGHLHISAESSDARYGSLPSTPVRSSSFIPGAPMYAMLLYTTGPLPVSIDLSTCFVSSVDDRATVQLGESGLMEYRSPEPSRQTCGMLCEKRQCHAGLDCHRVRPRRASDVGP
ncbi:hypothetical protein LZ30DRAFT_717307 [Colletotrichum cereale]|nr:hypothetical protein LZ30DRAFT_717307 [Colletotrichum cereale]